MGSALSIHQLAKDGSAHDITLKMFLDPTQKVNNVDEKGESALHVAARHGRRSIAKLLISKGADLSLKDKRGITPLHAAAAFGHSELVLILLENGADINATDEEGCSPSHHAAFYDRIEILLILINAGANARDFVNVYGKSALDMVKDEETKKQLALAVLSVIGPPRQPQEQPQEQPPPREEKPVSLSPPPEPAEQPLKTRNAASPSGDFIFIFAILGVVIALLLLMFGVGTQSS
jgi:hypothetical protein